MDDSQGQPLTRNLLVLDSPEAILALAPLLQDLAARCGQPGAMHWLPYFLDKAVLGKRAPRMVLFVGPEESQGQSLCANDLQAAALFFEYKVLGIRTGVVATGDAVGFNTVIGPANLRASAAALASRTLMEHGASLLVATFENGNSIDVRSVLADSPGMHWASRTRPASRMLSLLPSMEATLAQMGKTTRWNLRYYRRRLEKQMTCEYVPHAAPLLRGENLQAINSRSLNPVPADEFARRVACAADLPGSFLSGLRGPDGQWLSLVGGWRQADTTVLYWQMNTSGLEKHSIGTVMRSYFIEAEIAHGSRNLLIYGGTPHSMRHAFSEDRIADLVLHRPSLKTFALRRIARLLLSTHLLGKANFVVETLCDAELHWQTVGVPEEKARAAALKPVRAQRAA